MFKSLQFNWSYLLVIILTESAVILSIKGCDKPKEYSQEYVDSLLKSKDSAVAVAMQYESRYYKATEERDSIEQVGKKLKQEYQTKTRSERIVYIEKVIGPVESDSAGVRISYAQLDSINLIQIDKEICESLLSKADEQIDELFGATVNYKLGLNKADEVNEILQVELNSKSDELEKSKKKVKRNRKAAIIIGIVAIGEAAILWLRK